MLMPIIVCLEAYQFQHDVVLFFFRVSCSRPALPRKFSDSAH